jgi:hypothetical protein
MSGRYQQVGQLDQATLGDNDQVFLGVDMRLDAMALPAGFVAKAVNMVFRQGLAEPRPGFRTTAWARQRAVDFNINFPFDFDGTTGFGTVYGATTFSDPLGQERQILACASKSWSITPNAPPSVILYPPNVEISAPVSFTQAFQVLLMWRGKDQNPIKLDTALDFSVEPRWEEVPDETNEDYTSTIPDAERGCHYGNRVWVPFGNSQVAYSDLLAYTRYDADLSTIWVNEGESDVLLALAAYGNNSLVAFKSRSIYYIQNVLPDPVSAAHMQILTRQRGVVAPDSIMQVGRDLWFLADDGVYAITQVLENALQAMSDPVSAPMNPLIKRINWALARRAQATYQDSRYYLTVPIDGSTYNNVILVYDFINAQWAGWWEGDFLDVAYFLRIDVNGHRRVAFVSGDAIPGNEGRLYLLSEGGYTDENLDEESEIETEILTRGYTCQVPVDKMFLAAVTELRTWNGAGTIDVIRDGVNEEARVFSYEKDRLKYNLFARRAYDPTNTNDDFLAPFRQDYSVKLLPPPSGITLGTGIVCGLHQASSERCRIRQDTRYLQLRLRGTRGRNKLLALSIQAHADFIPLRSTI